jgi:hypothetical protein
MISSLVVWLEVLGGARPWPSPTLARSVRQGLWWLCLLLCTLAFAGRYSKFVYVDF